MSTNGNPVGTRKIAAAKDRMEKEQNRLKTVQVFAQDSEQASKVLGVTIKDGVVPSLGLVTGLDSDKLSLFRFLVNGAEVSADVITASLAVIKQCRKVIKQFGG